MGMQMHMGKDEKKAAAELTPVAIIEEIIPDSIFSLSNFNLEQVPTADTVLMVDSVKSVTEVPEKSNTKIKKNTTHKKPPPKIPTPRPQNPQS